MEEREPDVSALLRPLLGNGLLARAAGAVLGKGLSALGAQLRSAAAESEAVHERAAALVAADARVVAALGGNVRCGPPFAVSSSSSSINGVSSSSTTLQFMAEGATGRVAPVEVQSSSGGPLLARVRLPTGDVVLDSRDGRGGGGGRAPGGGQIIDVDARDYRVR